MKKYLINHNGLTLVELLLVLVITSIISVTIYSAFSTGIKLYQKIGIEGQLREDADYIATMILNELYENTPNYIEPYGDTGIRIVRYEQKTVDRYLINDSEAPPLKIVIYYEDNAFHIKNEAEDEEDARKIATNSNLHTKVTHEDGTKEETSIQLSQCSQEDKLGNCTHGMISLNLVLTDSQERMSKMLETNPLILKSTFGF